MIHRNLKKTFDDGRKKVNENWNLTDLKFKKNLRWNTNLNRLWKWKSRIDFADKKCCDFSDKNISKHQSQLRAVKVADPVTESCFENPHRYRLSALLNAPEQNGGIEKWSKINYMIKSCIKINFSNSDRSLSKRVARIIDQPIFRWIQHVSFFPRERLWMPNKVSFFTFFFFFLKDRYLWSRSSICKMVSSIFLKS